MTVNELIKELQDIKDTRGEYAGDLLVIAARGRSTPARSVVVSPSSAYGEIVVVDLKVT